MNASEIVMFTWRTLSLRAPGVSGGDYGGLVSASKNPVPGGQARRSTCGICRAGSRPTTAWQRRYLGGFALLLWAQPERFELSAPFRRSIAQPLDVDASRQTALDGGADQLGSKEGERDRHVDMADTALFA
jgi:hypothetical protein